MEASPQIDQNLYSRQIGAYGVETMGKLMSLKVFVYGLRGVIPDYKFLYLPPIVRSV